MEQKRIVQAFDRGLDVLVYLNTHDGASIGEVASATGINRGIVYRLLETLRKKNYVTKKAESPKYWLTNAVRNLADGFNDEEWVESIAKPVVNALGRDLMWPISLTTLSGNSMLVRVSSDSQSPLVLNRYSRGFRFSIPQSASGLSYLAFSTQQQRASLIEVLLRLLDDPDDLSILSSANLSSRLDKIRSQGYASVRGQLANTGAISVPIRFGDIMFGALSLRYFQSALSPAKAATQFYQPLTDSADNIAESLIGVDQHSITSSNKSDQR
ncbi:MAG: helix-turn-helix domain-containing protein [Rhodospirillaceae bacterium]